MALAQALDTDSVYVAKRRSIQVAVQLYTRFWRVKVNALLNCGATKNFIHLRLVKKLKPKTKLLKKPWQVKNVDGTTNKAGAVTEVAILEIYHKGYWGNHAFFVAEVDCDEILLSYLFLEAVNPEINWQSGKLYGAVTLKGTLKADALKVAKTTVMQQLAEAATDKKEQTWDEIILKRYHWHAFVFSEKELNRMPQHRAYDHQIILKLDAPAALNCQVYPMSPEEDKQLNKFIDENLKLGHIVRSDSPYASGFFFIKKDSKLQPVQDYRQLNKWIVPSQYSLSLIEDIIYKFSPKKWFTKVDMQ